MRKKKKANLKKTQNKERKKTKKYETKKPKRNTQVKRRKNEDVTDPDSSTDEDDDCVCLYCGYLYSKCNEG